MVNNRPDTPSVETGDAVRTLALGQNKPYLGVAATHTKKRGRERGANDYRSVRYVGES